MCVLINSQVDGRRCSKQCCFSSPYTNCVVSVTVYTGDRITAKTKGISFVFTLHFTASISSVDLYTFIFHFSFLLLVLFLLPTCFFRYVCISHIFDLSAAQSAIHTICLMRRSTHLLYPLNDIMHSYMRISSMYTHKLTFAIVV